MNAPVRLLDSGHPKNSGLALSPEHRMVIRILIIGVLLPLLDTTMLTVALHDIGSQLDAPLATTQWITTAYTLAAASIVPLSAWAANHVGGKRIWVASLLIFLFGTLLSAIAWNLPTLIAGRVIQGLAAGLMMPVMQTILVNTVGQKLVKTALGAMAVPSVIAPILGPLLGGLVLQQAGWREIFWLHVPICLLAIYLAARRLPSDKPIRESAAFDVRGFFLLCPGMVLTVYGLSTLGPLASGFGVSLLAVFALHSSQRGSMALVDLTLFKHVNFRQCALLLLLTSIVYYGGLLLLPLYFIQIGHYSVVAAGALIALHGVGTLISRRFLGQLTQRWGDRHVALCAILAMLVGSGALCLPWLLKNPFVLGMVILLRGAGVGVLTIQAMSSSYVGLDRAGISHASSMTRMITHLGAATGAAGTVALIGSSLSNTPITVFIGGYDAALLGMVLVSLLCIVPASRLGHEK